MQHIQSDITLHGGKYRKERVLGQGGLNRVLLISLLILFPFLVMAQASGGQISRTTNNNHKVAKKRSVPNNNSKPIIYPQRDDIFLTSAKLSPIVNTTGTLIQYKVLNAPNFNGHILERNSKRKQITLKQKLCKENEIIDNKEWYINNNLCSKKEYIQGEIQIKTGGFLVSIIERYQNAPKVLVRDESKTIIYAAYDFKNFLSSPKTKPSDSDFPNYQGLYDVIIEGNIMYVTHFGMTYAKEYGYQTGYISAINMLTDEVIWTTQPLTNNCREIAIKGNSIISGYGFTDEPDFLYIVDKFSGQRVKKKKKKKGPECIIIKESNVYVRTYSYDYVFEIR